MGRCPQSIVKAGFQSCATAGKSKPIKHLFVADILLNTGCAIIHLFLLIFIRGGIITSCFANEGAEAGANHIANNL